MGRLKLAGLAALGLLVLGGFGVQRLFYRALPQVDGRLRAPGLAAPVEVLRDGWGVPHIYAQGDDDAYFALGYVHAQDRLFQMELSRRVAQGRLSELLGPSTLRTDRLFRTMDFHGVGRRMLARSRPEIRSALAAYARGVNAWVERLDGRLPPEFVLLGAGFEPAQPDDFVGLLGYMTWGLNYSWHFDPLYEKLVGRLGPERAAELFPYNGGGRPSVYPGAPAGLPRLALFETSPQERGLLESLPSLRGSNNWAVAPQRSASGQALLANDPHLSHGLPGVWYEAHLVTPSHEVSGMTMAGLPLVILGHNRDVAWGFTNLMLDAADFFVEKLHPTDPGLVMYKGAWVPIETRTETLRVRGGPDETLVVRSTPHGPLVADLMGPERRALSYRWTYAAAPSNDVEAFYLLDRARNWDDFRAALSRFGAVAQNAAYADRHGHIGLQACGAIPRLAGATQGTLPRVGWDGSQEWDGFWPFQDNPFVLDPPEGLVSSANNPTLPPPSPYYISSQWEPVDRITRIRELLAAKPRLSLDDLARIQSDVTLVTARELAPQVVAAFEAEPDPDPVLRAALAELKRFDGRMLAEDAAPTIFAAFYRRLFYVVFEDELGPGLAAAYRSRANLSATMLRVAFEPGHERWFDLVDTPGLETREQALRAALRQAVHELERELGPDVPRWAWGRLHTLELRHPLARASALLGRVFDLGPVPVPGATSTVDKMEYDETSFRVLHGPSFRRLIDFADLNAVRSVLPAGQSGLRVSRHYGDQFPLWLSGRHRLLRMDRAAVEAEREGRLTLVP